MVINIGVKNEQKRGLKNAVGMINYVISRICKKETQACKSNRFTKEFQAEWPVLLGRNGLKIYHDVISSKYMVKCAHIGQYHNFRTGDQF